MPIYIHEATKVVIKKTTKVINAISSEFLYKLLSPLYRLAGFILFSFYYIIKKDASGVLY